MKVVQFRSDCLLWQSVLCQFKYIIHVISFLTQEMSSGLRFLGDHKHSMPSSWKKRHVVFSGNASREARVVLGVSFIAHITPTNVTCRISHLELKRYGLVKHNVHFNYGYVRIPNRDEFHPGAFSSSRSLSAQSLSLRSLCALEHDASLHHGA